MTSAYSINLNFNNTIPVKTDFTFKQGDKGITLNLATTGLDTTGTTAKIVFKRSNGTSVEADLVGAGPTYSYTILGNEFEIPGVVVADLKLYNGDTQRVSTASFIFLVTGDTMDGIGGGTGGYSDQLEELSQEFSDTLEEYKDAFGDVGAVNPRGAYDSTADYNVLDLVSYQGSSYLCRTACKNKVPTNTTYWQVFASGAQGVDYDDLTGKPSINNVTLSGDKTTADLGLPSDFDDLADVDMTGVTDGQVPTWDATAQKYKPGTPAAGGGTNPNLFMNPWFTINQRGASGLIPTQTYGYDKWISINGSYSVTANGFVYSGSGAVVYIWDSQPISSGGTFTYSVRYADDTIASVSGTFTANQSYIADSNEKITIADATQVNLSGFNTNKVVKAVKLEVGSESTLAADHAPDYQTELLKIQKASLAAIAQVEPDDKAISAHSVGSFFVDKNGKMCRVTSDISQGATITIGTNCSETDVGKEIEKFAIKKLNSNATNNVHSDYNFDAFILLGQYSGTSIYDVVTVAPSATITHFGNATGITVTSVDQNNVKITVPIYYNCRITGNGGNITIS